MKEEKKVCQEIGENKVSKVNRDTWVFLEMPVKRENKVSKGELESQVSQDLQVKQVDQVILVYPVKLEIKVFLENRVIRAKGVNGGLLDLSVKKVKRQPR